MNKALFIARLLYRHPDGLAKRDILAAWADEDDAGRPMAESTFYDNRGYLATRFGLHIDCRGGRYRLVVDESMDNALLRHLVGDTDATDAQDAPQPGDEWLPVVADAIALSRRLLLTYAPLDKPSYSTDLCPYTLRRIHGRNYLVGLSRHHNEVRTFALDRIAALSLRTSGFRRPTDFNADAWFAAGYGAFGGATLMPEHVVLRPLTAHIAAYLRQRPLHTSQREVSSSHSESTISKNNLPTADFALDVALTPDFLNTLLTLAPDVRILAPDALRRRIAEIAHQAAAING